MATTFDPTTNHNFTLSGGNLTAAISSFAQSGLWSTNGKTTGQWYFEITGNSISSSSFSFNFGLVNASWVFGNGGIGDETSRDSVGFYPGSVTIGYEGAVGIGVVVPAVINTAGTVFGVAVDLTAKLVWVTDDNGTHWNGATSGQVPGVSGGRSFSGINAGPYFIGVAGYQNSPADSYTLNTGNTAFAYTVPSGFTGWDLIPTLSVVPAPINRLRYGVVTPPTPNLKYGFMRRQSINALGPPQPAVMPYTNRNRFFFQVPQLPEKIAIPRAKTIALGSIPFISTALYVAVVVREVLVADSGPSIQVDGVVREVLVKNTTPLVVDGVVREILGAFVPPQGPIPIFPTLPYGFPVKVRPNMNTIVGASTSDREVRVPMQQMPLWEIELLFEELRDQGQNVTPGPIAGFTQYMQLVGLWLSMYGQAGVFAFDAPWDDSRLDQPIGTGDGSSYVFNVYRTWGQSPEDIQELVGLVNTVTNVKVNGVVVNPAQYFIIRNKIYFMANGFVYPPANGAAITMTFSFYYVCRFMANNQDYEQFSQGRWTVPSLKFQSVYWP